MTRKRCAAEQSPVGCADSPFEKGASGTVGRQLTIIILRAFTNTNGAPYVAKKLQNLTRQENIESIINPRADNNNIAQDLQNKTKEKKKNV